MDTASTITEEALALDDVRAFVRSARLHAASYADRVAVTKGWYCVGMRNVVNARSVDEDARPSQAFLSRRRNSSAHSFGTGTAHVPPLFQDHVQVATPVIDHDERGRRRFRYGSDVKTDEAALSSRPHAFRVAPVAGTVHTESSRAERKARVLARIRLLELLGLDHGHTPATVGDSHVPRPLRLHRDAERHEQRALGPGSYDVNRDAERFCARTQNRGGMPAWRLPTTRRRAPKPASPRFQPPVTTRKLDAPQPPREPDHESSSDASCESKLDDSMDESSSAFSSSTDTWSSRSSAVSELSSSEASASEDAAAPETYVATSNALATAGEHAQRMVNALRREAQRRAVHRLATAEDRAIRASDLDKIHRRSTRNVIMPPLPRGKSRRIRGNLRVLDWMQRARGWPHDPSQAAKTSWAILQRLTSVLDALVYAADAWERAVPDANAAGTPTSAVPSPRNSLSPRVPSGRWVTSWKREQVAQELSSIAKAARRNREHVSSTLDEDVVREETHRVAEQRVARLLKQYAVDLGYSKRPYPLQSHALPVASPSFVDFRRMIGRPALRGDAAESSGMLPASVFPAPPLRRGKSLVDMARSRGRGEFDSDMDARLSSDAPQLSLRVPTGRLDRPAARTHSFSRSDRFAQSDADSDGGDVYLSHLVVQSHVPSDAPIRKRALSAPPFSLQLGRPAGAMDELAGDDLFPAAPLLLDLSAAQAHVGIRGSRFLHVDFAKQRGRPDVSDSLITDFDVEKPLEQQLLHGRGPLVVPSASAEAAVAPPRPQAWSRAPGRPPLPRSDARKLPLTKAMAMEFDLGV